MVREDSVGARDSVMARGLHGDYQRQSRWTIAFCARNLVRHGQCNSWP